MKYREIISRMTLEEKASLMSGKDFWQSQDIERLGIPSMFLADGPHGIRKQAVAADHPGLNKGIPATCFPTAATVANSWNLSLGEKVGEHLGQEAVSQKVHVLLGPGINMKRNPLCGRNFEYFSEDPYLAGKLAAAYVRGIQSQGISACVKHFAVSNQEERSMSIDTVLDERTLREIYLTAFEIAVKEGGAKALMSAYNKINGTYANENKHLMQDILREEWGYKGCVITNWGGSNDRVAGLLAGNELEMPGKDGESDRRIIQAVRTGAIEEEALDRCVDRLLELVFSTEETFSVPHVDFNESQHHRVTQRVAEESIVLLKNEDRILPLKFGRKVAVIGEFAKNARYQGAGSSIVNPTILDSTLECFYESGISSIGYEKGFDRYGRKSRRKIEKACALAQKADAVLLYLGLDEVTEAQGLDRKDMKLPANQIDLLDALYEVNQNLIVILSCGSAIEMPWIGKVKALLHGYLGGQAGARAILRVISGDVNPSGKLAESYPLRYEDTPSCLYFPGKELTAEYREGPYIGYRYYGTAEVDVLFPFGFGLSYTTFVYSDIRIDRDGVCFKLTNSGDAAGMEVAQLYVGCPSGKVYRPRRELKGFKKVFINAGETKEVRMEFDDKAFRYFNTRTRRWEIETAEYSIMIGASSADIRLQGTVHVEGGSAPIPWSGKDLPSYFSGDVRDVSTEEFEMLLGHPAPEASWDPSSPLGYNDTIAQCRYARGWAGRFAYKLVIFSYWLMRKIGKRSAANIIIMSFYHMPFRGIARFSAGKVNMPMVDGLLMIANGRFCKGVTHFFREKWKMKKAE